MWCLAISPCCEPQRGALQTLSRGAKHPGQDHPARHQGRFQLFSQSGETGSLWGLQVLTTGEILWTFLCRFPKRRKGRRPEFCPWRDHVSLIITPDKL